MSSGEKKTRPCLEHGEVTHRDVPRLIFDVHKGKEVAAKAQKDQEIKLQERQHPGSKLIRMQNLHMQRIRANEISKSLAHLMVAESGGRHSSTGAEMRRVQQDGIH